MIWRRLCPRALDFGWSDCHAIAVFEHIVARYRLTIDSNEIVSRLSPGHLLVEELIDSHTVTDVDIVGKTGSIVVDIEYFHFQFLSLLLVSNFSS